MKSVTQIRAAKGKEKLTVLSLYDFQSAQLLDGMVDIYLVGDSLGMAVYGLPSTLPVTMEMMVNHGAAVKRGAEKTFVVVDMPFNSYHQSPAQAFDNAAKIMAATNCNAVKIEGGEEMAETVRFLTERGIPVMGHIGLQPQSFNAYGGYKVQGKTKEDSAKILNAAKKLEEAGCFSIVIEGVKREVADEVTNALQIPTIGIGASVDCDGQVLVLLDLLGMNDKPAKFVKTYADLREIVSAAVEKFAAEVKAEKFPTADNLY